MKQGLTWKLAGWSVGQGPFDESRDSSGNLSALCASPSRGVWVPAPRADLESKQASSHFSSCAGALVPNVVPRELIVDNALKSRNRHSYNLESFRAKSNSWEITGKPGPERDGSVVVAVGRALEDPSGADLALFCSPWAADAGVISGGSGHPPLALAVGSCPEAHSRWPSSIFSYTAPWSMGVTPEPSKKLLWDPCNAGCAALWLALASGAKSVKITAASGFAFREDSQGSRELSGGWKTFPELALAAASWSVLFELARRVKCGIAVESDWDPRD